MRLEQPHAPNPVDRQLDLLFVPGEDDSGRHDACLVSERTFDQAAALESHCGETIYTLRFNRSRERGRGWVMAGFEVVGSRPARAAA